MPKGKAAKGPKVTLKTAKNAIQRTEEGQRRLSLSKMGITVFPKCLVKLTNVDELDLSRNLIQKIPNEIGKMSSLKSLDLHSNKLESVPESIGNLVKLTHLNLSNNCLTSAGIPSTLGFLTSLKTLNLGMNQLDMLPPTLEALDSLEELGLFDNLFIKPPEFLTVLCNLTKVNMERNPLKDAPKHVSVCTWPCLCWPLCRPFGTQRPKTIWGPNIATGPLTIYTNLIRLPASRHRVTCLVKGRPCMTVIRRINHCH
uniref:Uncharacterized protein n=1 Tax=Mola mola TaxID=94237 RepID=A0A3Q3WY09_MOLML